MAMISTSDNTTNNNNTVNNNNNMIIDVSDGQTMISFTVEGKPIPLARPRFTTARRNGIYMQHAPSRSEFRRAVLALRDANNSRMLSVDAKLSITIIYSLKRPLFHFRGRNRENGVVPCRVTRGHPTAGGDLDNLVKFTLDALQGCLFPNDRQIVHICATKVFSDDPHSEGSTTVVLKEVC